MSNPAPAGESGDAQRLASGARKRHPMGMRLLKSICACVALLALGLPAEGQGARVAKPAAPAATQARPQLAQPSRAAKKSAKRSAKAPEPQPQARVTPPPPPTPAQLPPTPARVRMRNGLLTIEANNSTLADVLSGVRRETKAAIDLPPGASGERVVANLGPGTPQNVLATLFNGSRFDYIILGSQDEPDAVQRVILRAKSGPEPGPAPVTASAVPAPGTVRPQPIQQPEDQGDEDQGAPAEEAPDEGNQQQPPQQEIDNEQQQGQPQNQQPQPGVKTPEQLLEELRQMQQQQQQNQPQQQQPDEQ